MKKTLLGIYNSLLNSYGERNWWPAKNRFEVIVGAVLVQNVSWSNAEKAVNNLKKYNLLNPPSIHKSSVKKLAPLIRSSRFYNQKAEKLKNFTDYLFSNYNGSLNKMFAVDTEKLRKELLDIKGIGRETADSILLYAGKKPSFVSDAYTKRFLERYGLLNGLSSYEEIRSLFMDNIPEDTYMYNEYHALIVHHGYAVCKSKPSCQICPVKKISKKIYCSHPSNFEHSD